MAVKRDGQGTGLEVRKQNSHRSVYPVSAWCFQKLMEDTVREVEAGIGSLNGVLVIQDGNRNCCFSFQF